jgi:hypothetical protein
MDMLHMKFGQNPLGGLAATRTQKKHQKNLQGTDGRMDRHK